MQMDQLDTELREGEYIQWQGRTGAFSLLEPQARRTIFGKWLGTLVAGGILLALAGREDAGVGPAAVIAIVLGTAALLAAPVLEWWALRGQHYWITNQRAIVMTREHRICSMELEEIDDVCLVQGENGMNSLILGNAPGEAQWQMRWFACHPRGQLRPGEAEGQAVSMVFYGLMNAKDALAWLLPEQGAQGV